MVPPKKDIISEYAGFVYLLNRCMAKNHGKYLIDFEYEIW